MKSSFYLFFIASTILLSPGACVDSGHGSSMEEKIIGTWE